MKKQQRRDALIITVIVLMAIAALAIAIKLNSRITDVDERTKMLCREYAARDHKAEISPDRYEKLGKEFFESFDWYTSCINHIKFPVSGETP